MQAHIYIFDSVHVMHVSAQIVLVNNSFLLLLFVLVCKHAAILLSTVLELCNTYIKFYLKNAFKFKM